MRVISERSFIFDDVAAYCMCGPLLSRADEDLLTGTLVINASITNIPGIQTIQISRSDGLIYPEFIPEIGLSG